MSSVTYPKQAQELVQLLAADQKEHKAFARTYYWGNHPQDDIATEAKTSYKKHVQARALHMLEILQEIGNNPSLTNIGRQAAQAVSVLATHSSLDHTRKVLDAFRSCYMRNRADTFYQAIPPMTDWVLVLEQKPQKFGTMWLFDNNKRPYLPPVENFECVNERRAKYDLEPLRWPKSLAIPEDEQPWLHQPLSQLAMRQPTEEEYAELAADYV